MHFNKMNFHFLQFRPRLDTCGVVCFVFFILSSVRWPLRAACPFMTLVPRDGLLASGQSLVRVRASSVLISGRKRPRRVRSARGVPRPPFASGSFPAYLPSSRITNTLRAGYRTLASSRPIVLLGRHVMASSVTGPGAPRPAATGRDRAGRAPTNRRVAHASSDLSDKDRERIGRAIYPRRPSLSAHFTRSAHPPSGAPERAASAIQSAFLPSAAPPLFSFWQPQHAVKGRIAFVVHGGVLAGFPP